MQLRVEERRAVPAGSKGTLSKRSMKETLNKKERMQLEYEQYERSVSCGAKEAFNRPAYAYTLVCKDKNYGVNKGERGKEDGKR